MQDNFRKIYRLNSNDNDIQNLRKTKEINTEIEYDSEIGIATNNLGAGINQPQMRTVLTKFGSIDNGEAEFEIENRTIISYVSLVDLVVQFDSNSRVLQFKLPKTFDGVDLSLKKVNVNFINANKKSGYSSCTITSIKDDSFIVEWIIGPEVTTKNGRVEYGIEFFEKNLENEKIYVWQTKPSSFNVEESIITLNNAIPEKYNREKTFYAESNNASQYLEIRDDNSAIQIDNRTILTGTLKDVVVANDNVSQIVSFRINRYFSGVDLATKLISIKYINAAGRSDRSNAINVKLYQLELEFGWLIDSKFTEKDGIGKIAIEFLGYDENGDFYVWQTKPVNFPIERGLFVDGFIENSDPSWLQSLNLSIVQLQMGKADLIDGKVPSSQLPSGYGDNTNLINIESRLLDLENKIDTKAQTVYADNYLMFPNIGNEKDIYIDRTNDNTYMWDKNTFNYRKIRNDYNNIAIIYGGNASG